MTIEGMLLVSKHGTHIANEDCEAGVPISWKDDTANLRELSDVAEAALAEPRKVKVRVTGQMRLVPTTEFLNEPAWQLGLSSAKVLSNERAPN